MLIKQALSRQITALYTEASTGEGITKEQFASKLADIIDSYIRTATVKTIVTGTASDPAVTGTGTGQLQ